MGESSALLERQRALQVEAHQVLEDLHLMEILGQAVRPVLVGSLALGQFDAYLRQRSKPGL